MRTIPLPAALLAACFLLPAAAQTPSLAGKWNWGAGGGIVEIDTAGAGRDARGNTLRWTLQDPAARVYVLRWSHNYTDTATLSPDGNSLSAVNQHGLRFTATRRSQPPPPSRPADLNGSWSNGLVHIWQNGHEVLMTASWKRDDGKYVVIRGEGRLNGNVADLLVRYSPMTHGPVPDWRGLLTLSPDGATIQAHYSLNGQRRDSRLYHRDR